MLSRRASAAIAALTIYLVSAFVAPWAHRAHHAAHGADHVHADGVTTYFQHADSFDHARADEVLAALDLAEVASAGIPAVDCELAAYTLVDCSVATSAHAVAFGDDAHQDAPHDRSPTHGRGSLEHGDAPLLGAGPTIALSPPRLGSLHAAVTPLLSCSSVALPVATCRGPPV